MNDYRQAKYNAYLEIDRETEKNITTAINIYKAGLYTTSEFITQVERIGQQTRNELKRWKKIFKK